VVASGLSTPTRTRRRRQQGDSFERISNRRRVPLARPTMP
jgi:hypothetical protein